MKAKNTSVSIETGGLGTLLTIIFVILKFCKVITWKWVYVFLPLIISTGIAVLGIIIMVIAAVVGNLEIRKINKK